MNRTAIQSATAEHMRYLPSREKVATSIAAQLMLPPFPPGTTVRVGRHQTEGGDIPAQYPRLHSSRVYVHVTAWGWIVVDRGDLVPISR